MPDILSPGAIIFPSGRPYVPARDIPALLSIKNKRMERVRFHLNRVQLDYLSKKSARNIDLKARQVGFTSGECADNCCRTILGGNISYAFVLDEESKAYAWRQIIDEWVKIDLRKVGITPRIGLDNKTTISFPDIGSEIHVFTAGKRAPGRSAAYNILHLSEISHYGDAQKTFTALKPSVPPPPYGIITEESTPNGIGDVFWEDWQAAKVGITDAGIPVSIYKPHFYAWWWDDAYRIEAPTWFRSVDSLNEREKYLHEAEKLTYDQLWWRRVTIEDMARAGNSFAQEYPEDDESCFIGSGSKVFDRQGVAYLHTLIRPPFRVLWDGALLVWQEPQVGHRYVIGADTAQGMEGDFHAALVVDKTGTEHVATLRTDSVTPNVFARLLDDLGRLYVHRGQQAYLGVERRASGYTVLEELEELGYNNLHSEVSRVENRRPIYESGVMVSDRTKVPLVNDLQEIIRTAGLITHDRVLVEELSNYVQQREGGRLKTHAAGSGHDDMVAALMIAIRMLEEAPLPRDDRASEPIDLLARRTV